MRDLVYHPRYGDEPIPAPDGGADEATVRSSYWGYRRPTIFPETAIPADWRRQDFTTFPRAMYVDVLKECRDCGRPFLFFAREQRYWYEELGFYVDADCVRCVGCRIEARRIPRARQRYQELVGRAELSSPELADLARAAVVLWEAGLLRDDQKLRRIRNRLRERGGDRAAIRAIERALGVGSGSGR